MNLFPYLPSISIFFKYLFKFFFYSAIYIIKFNILIKYKYKEKTKNKTNNISIKDSTMEKKSAKDIIESFEHFDSFCSAIKR